MLAACKIVLGITDYRNDNFFYRKNEHMLQDILPKKYDNNYYADKAPDDNAICLIFKDSYVLTGHKKCEGTRYIPEESASSLEKNAPAGDVFFPKYGQIKDCVAEYRYLFAIDNEEYFLVTHYIGSEPDWEKLGFAFEHYKALRHAKPKYRVFALMTGYHLHCWYRDNAHCGRCGSQTFHDTRLRAVRCPNCGNLIFPRISPAVIVGVHDGSHLLMTKYNGRDYKGYALIAGFIEIGESAEDTVRREVFEEVGVKVKNISYYASQPWGMDGGFLLGFYAELDGNDRIALDREELSMAGWYTPDEITVNDDDISLTSCMIDNWKRTIARRD